MELRQLRYFVTVAEELHFGRAAQRLHVAQPAVSQQLGRLERELGVRLLERTSRRVTLTAHGTRLLGEARKALAAVERVRSTAAELTDARALRVGTTPGVAGHLSHAAARLRDDAPDLTFALVHGTPAEHAAALRTGELDIALVRGTPPGHDLRADEVWREPVQVVLPAAHPAAVGPTVPVQALADLVLRLPELCTDPVLTDAVLAGCRAAGVVPRLGRPVRSIEDAAIEIGMSVRDATVVCGCASDGETALGAVVRPLAPAVEIPTYLVTGPEVASSCAAALAAALS